nr:MAG TPA: hypothetical protein [Caudoviricetes sp.]
MLTDLLTFLFGRSKHERFYQRCNNGDWWLLTHQRRNRTNDRGCD